MTLTFYTMTLWCYQFIITLHRNEKSRLYRTYFNTHPSVWRSMGVFQM